MPTPKKNERRKNFIKRCIPHLFNEEPETLTSKDKKSKQAYAICNSMYDDKKNKKNIKENVNNLILSYNQWLNVGINENVNNIEFSVGDLVIVNDTYNSKILLINNKIGKIIKKNFYGIPNRYLVKFDDTISKYSNYFLNGFNDNGRIDKYGKCWVFNKTELTLHEKKYIDYMKWENIDNNMIKESNTYSVGDIVNIYYWVTKEPTSVKITNIRTSNNRKLYTVSFDLRNNMDIPNTNTINSNLFNAPNMVISEHDIINSVMTVDTPAGPTWISNDPNIQTYQVSNDMYI